MFKMNRQNEINGDESGDENSLYLSRESSLNSMDGEDSNESESICSFPQKVVINASLLQRNTKLAKTCVMTSAVFERAAYYSLSGNLIIFLYTNLNYTSTGCSIMTLAFLGMTWFSCLVGGIFGDMVFGRFKTIILGLFFYLFGFAMLPGIKVLANPHDRLINDGSKPLYVAWLAFALFAVSLGEGLFKSNMSPFGADQLTKAKDNELRSFFSYYYWAINIGCFLGYSALTYIQQEFGFVIGYMVPCGFLVLSLVCFSIPRTKNYHIATPSNASLLKKIIQILYNAKSRKCNKQLTTSYESFVPVQHWLDRAKIIYGGKYSDVEIEDVKKLFSVLPVFGFLIIYCIGYFQIQSTFLIQGIHMRVVWIFGDLSVPACWLSLVNIIVVLLFVPIIDRYVYPLLEKWGTISPYLFRISIGMLLAVFSLYCAGTLEHFRQQESGVVYNHFDHLNITATKMSILYQVPQYALMGLSEIFVFITGLEFAYCQSPKSMQSLVTSLFFFANGLGALLGSAFIAIGNSVGWDILPSGDNHSTEVLPNLGGHLSYYFYFLAVLSCLNWIRFLLYGVRQAERKRKRELDVTVSAYIQGSMEASLQY